MQSESFPQLFCIKARKMAHFGRNMQVFRTIHRVFHSFAHNQEKDVENFFTQKTQQIRLTNKMSCAIIGKTQESAEYRV